MNEKFCYGCMRSYTGEECTCGWKYDYDKEDSESILVPGMLLNGGGYMLGRKLGRGGFGVTYIGMQQNELGLKVAIKEYFPKKIACRNVRFSCNLMPLYKMGMTNQDKRMLEERYENGKKEFIEEAKRLAELNELASIVSVLGYFEENNTAYIVMEYIDGIDLYHYMWKNGKTMKLKEVEDYIYPIIRDLGQVHQMGIIHRDISPDNIMVTKSGNVKLIDFGASITRDSEEEVKVLRKNGFAPLEQYDTANTRLGAWTDVYAMCATIYYLLSGSMIPDARDRQFFDRYETLRVKNIMIPKRLDNVLKKGLAIDCQKRFHSMKELLRQLAKVRGKGRGGAWIMAGGIFAMGCLGLFAGYWQFYNNDILQRENILIPYSKSTYVQELYERTVRGQTDSADNYAVYGNLVYIRYKFEDGMVMLVRSPIGADALEDVEYVTDGSIDSFCVDEDYLYFISMEDRMLYRADIQKISEVPDEQQRIDVWKENGNLERVVSYALDTEYGFTIADGYLYTVIRSEDGAYYEILRAAVDGTKSSVTEMKLDLTNCIFYDGYIYMTVRKSKGTVLQRMRMDGCYFEELATYFGDIPAMRIVGNKIYYLFNAEDEAEESCLGRISISGGREEKLSVRTDADMQYCYMTGVVDENSIYYTCSVKGEEALNNLYCYSLENGSSKQISSECGRYIVTSDEVDTIIFASVDGSEIRQMNKDGSNPHVMRSADGSSGIIAGVDVKSLSIICDHVYYLDGDSVAYKRIIQD